MPTIAIAPFHWNADLHCAWGLARKLRRRGHRVVFLCVPDAAARIRSQGFECREIFSGVYPPGAVERQNLDEAHGRAGETDGFEGKLAGMCEALRNGEIDRLAADVQPALVLASSWTPWTAIAATRTGAPVATFSSTLVSIPDPMVPPFSSPLTPDSPLFRLRTAWAWRRFFFGRRSLRGGVDARAPLVSLARACGYPPDRIDFRVETWPRLELPEIVFCPEEFDLPRARPVPNARFVESSIDLERVDREFPWGRLDSDRPIVYCSTGSVLTVKVRAEADRFTQAFLDALRARPDWQGVATIGRYSDPAAFHCPPNVLLVDVAPQLRVLARARLHVTHAGLTSVKESIYFGVPMIAAPRFYDQAGNAARIVHHGLGLRADWMHPTARRLGALMDRVIEQTDFARSAGRMSEAFVRREERSEAVEIVERLATR